jgi:hypothetical protein
MPRRSRGHRVFKVRTPPQYQRLVDYGMVHQRNIEDAQDGGNGPPGFAGAGFLADQVVDRRYGMGGHQPLGSTSLDGGPRRGAGFRVGSAVQ